MRDDQLAIVRREITEFLLLYPRDDLERWMEVWYGSASGDGVPQAENITADLDGNGRVDGGDLGLFVANWKRSGCGDLDENGIVRGADLGLPVAAGKWSNRSGDGGSSSRGLDGLRLEGRFRRMFGSDLEFLYLRPPHAGPAAEAG